MLRTLCTLLMPATLSALALGVLVHDAPAQRINLDVQKQPDASVMPKQLEDVNLSEKLGAQVPIGTPFRDLEEKSLEIGRLFQGDKPILLTLNYATCPKLCGLQLKGLADALSGLAVRPGEDYAMITISLDPTEKAAQTIAVRDGFLRHFPEGMDKSAWHFLRGEEASIRAVADAVGFQYSYDEETGEYLHPALAMVLSPEGKVMRYIEGLVPEPATLRLAIAEAAEGKQGLSLGDRVLLFCYTYSSETGKYTLAIWKLVRFAAVFTVLSMAAGFWMLQRSRAKDLRNDGFPQGGTP